LNEAFGLVRPSIPLRLISNKPEAIVLSGSFVGVLTHLLADAALQCDRASESMQAEPRSGGERAAILQVELALPRIVDGAA
jgi:hypothetical protein